MPRKPKDVKKAKVATKVKKAIVLNDGKKEREAIIYEDDKYILSRDSRNWIVTQKNSEGKFFYSNLYYFIQFLIDRVFSDNIVKKGLEDTLNSLSSLYKEANKQITTVADSIAEISKTLEKVGDSAEEDT